ncbi:hypothetical protein EHR_09810 [Enterococcus hirae ATCC 9790]|uniref:Uncharacterized protein n=1 Tax=Enterococcus hirae (strain ATCC 9790 / DSM 20160 / JCM 8729 / LMG 6399 / NBRC 3181 / NCIMB 6459 / NCDO 1258 / NCTC 12367 / WDCM 00089 / R) TaxID=768486 RepID=I6S2D8_ENTHA|nr:hypothetical protein EHR_09810 [Enterococcus hirae ATCC 9790]
MFKLLKKSAVIRESLIKLVKVVDVKGMQTKDFKIKAKLFCHRYQVPLILAKKYGKTFKEERF